MALTRSQIEAVLPQSFRQESIDVPEFGGAVSIRVVSGAEREAFTGDTGEDVAVRFLSRVLVDEQGARLYGDDALDALRSWPADVLDRILIDALRVNGMHETGKAQAGSAPGGSA